MARQLWMLLCFFVLCSCDEQRVYEEFITLPAYWHQDDERTFAFEIEDDSIGYDLIAQFKQDIDYPNYNFYFLYSLRDGRDTLLEERLEEAVFFEPKTGAPLGSGIGDAFDHEFVLEENFRFSEPGSYEISFRQFMRVDSIPNILRLGLRVEKAMPN